MGNIKNISKKFKKKFRVFGYPNSQNARTVTEPISQKDIGFRYPNQNFQIVWFGYSKFQIGQRVFGPSYWLQIFLNTPSTDIPNAFWDKKQHMVDEERNIPTKAQPIQMNKELLEFCKIEIQSFLDKRIIRFSKSHRRCAAFYKQKRNVVFLN